MTKASDTQFRAGASGLRVPLLEFEVYGHFGVPCGLRVSADNTVKMLRAKSNAFRLHCVSEASEEQRVEGGALARRSQIVNLFHVNPVTLLALMRTPHHEPFRFLSRMNVCVPFWELPHVPDFWIPILRGMDLVLAPTQFIADAIQASDPSIRVRHFPQTVFIPENVAPQRERFGFPNGVTVFGTSFAAQAVAERKNPWAVIEAFHAAFPSEPNVRLVVRAYDAGGADASPFLRSLVELAKGDPRIVVMSERLDYDEVMGLYASYDVFVSLHRSEGLGLGPMEAMSVGTPVIGTGWSGNMDFMTAENSCLVAYTLVPVCVDPSSPYGTEIMREDEVWAEPDVEDAARYMRVLHADPTLRAGLGIKAKSDMSSRHAEIIKGAFVDELGTLASDIGSHRRAHFARAFSLSVISLRQQRDYWTNKFRRAVVAALRTLHLKPPAPEGEAR